MVIPTTAYNTIPNAVPFVHPQDPGPFIITQPTEIATRTSSLAALPITAAIVTQHKSDHDERLLLHNECQAVVQALRQQLVEAIESEYLDALRDPNTLMIQLSIPDITDLIPKTYGFLTEKQLSDKFSP